MKIKRPSLPDDVHLWKWSHRATLPDGTRVTFRGSVKAPANQGWQMADKIDRALRAKYPEARWMRGKLAEKGHVKFGPSYQRGKFLRAAAAIPPAAGHS